MKPSNGFHFLQCPHLCFFLFLLRLLHLAFNSLFFSCRHSIQYDGCELFLRFSPHAAQSLSLTTLGFGSFGGWIFWYRASRSLLLHSTQYDGSELSRGRIPHSAHGASRRAGISPAAILTLRRALISA